MTMAAFDTLNFPNLESVLTSAAGFMNSTYLPAATPGSVGAALAAVPCVVALLWLARRLTARPRADSGLTARFDDLSQRLQTTELLLADATSETARLRQRVDQLTSRQENISTGNSRTSLRQAIALSKHGATTRQLIDTCSLSHGEAHLIQNLYGRPAGNTQPDELH
jgi:hypothetical protein